MRKQNCSALPETIPTLNLNSSVLNLLLRFRYRLDVAHTKLGLAYAASVSATPWLGNNFSRMPCKVASNSSRSSDEKNQVVQLAT